MFSPQKKKKKKKAVFILSKCIEMVSMYYLPYGPQCPTPETGAANLFCSCLPLFWKAMHCISIGREIEAGKEMFTHRIYIAILANCIEARFPLL